MNPLQNPTNNTLSEDELANGMHIIGDTTESEEATLEAEEARFGDSRDVMKDIPGIDGHDQVMPTQDQLPEGMESAIRGEDGEAVEVDGDDEETGEDKEQDAS